MPNQIVGLCVAKNEADIIEAMVRHNLAYLDAVHVVDNESADATPEILSALAAEYSGRLTWSVDTRAGHVQTDIINESLAPLAAATDASQIVLVDADEVLRGDPQVFRDTLRDRPAPVLLPWVTYVPTGRDDGQVLNPVARITHRRQREVPQYFKTTVPVSAIGRARVMAGSHGLKGDGSEGAAVVAGLSLAHFPVRSREQLTSKVLIGAWNLRLRGSRKPREGHHWLTLAERIMSGDRLSEADLQAVAMGYAALAEVGLVEDALIPGEAAELKYTPVGSDSLLRNLTAFTEACVRRLEERGPGIAVDSAN